MRFNRCQLFKLHLNKPVLHAYGITCKGSLSPAVRAKIAVNGPLKVALNGLLKIAVNGLLNASSVSEWGVWAAATLTLSHHHVAALLTVKPLEAFSGGTATAIKAVLTWCSNCLLCFSNTRAEQATFEDRIKAFRKQINKNKEGVQFPCVQWNLRILTQKFLCKRHQNVTQYIFWPAEFILIEHSVSTWAYVVSVHTSTEKSLVFGNMNQKNMLLTLSEGKKSDAYNEYIMSSRNNECTTTTTPSAPQQRQDRLTHIYNSCTNNSPCFRQPGKNRWTEDAQYELLLLNFMIHLGNQNSYCMTRTCKMKSNSVHINAHNTERKLPVRHKKKKDRQTNLQACIQTHRHTHTLGGCAPDILQSETGAGETVMDYRHIWAVISRSCIPPAFSRRQKSCIMVSYRGPGTPGCIMPCQRACTSLVVTGFTTGSRLKQSSVAIQAQNICYYRFRLFGAGMKKC